MAHPINTALYMQIMAHPINTATVQADHGTSY